MKYSTLATDYDGTIAHDGIVSDDTIASLERFRASGRTLILVTGRELDELLVVCPRLDLFARVVAENGALLYRPSDGTRKELSPAPPKALLEELHKRQVPFSAGRSIVATVEPYELAVFASIRDLGLEWHVIFNKGAVMALPSNITKATGLTVALKELDIAADNVVGVGDAENDHAFLRMCKLSVAVDNALPSLKETVDWQTPAARGAGVSQLIDLMLANDLDKIAIDPQQHDRAS